MREQQPQSPQSPDAQQQGLGLRPAGEGSSLSRSSGGGAATTVPSPSPAVSEEGSGGAAAAATAGILQQAWLRGCDESKWWGDTVLLKSVPIVSALKVRSLSAIRCLQCQLECC